MERGIGVGRRQAPDRGQLHDVAVYSGSSQIVRHPCKLVSLAVAVWSAYAQG